LSKTPKKTGFECLTDQTSNGSDCCSLAG